MCGGVFVFQTAVSLFLTAFSPEKLNKIQRFVIATNIYMVYVYGICIWYMYMVTRRGPVGPALGRGSQRLVTIYIYHIHIPYTYTISHKCDVKIASGKFVR